MLAKLVEGGKLPPLAQRLPENPYVVPHTWLTAGKYGGQMRWICSDQIDWGVTRFIQQSMYGHSPLRFLKEGTKIGPGLAESWESNKDATVWTLHFRKGLRWSDGEPWTVDDILFWWEDQVKVPELNEPIPDEARSSKGTLVTMKKLDDYTLELAYDAPSTLTADRVAMNVKRGIGTRWMDPKHYLMQFHIKYNPNLDKTTWVKTFTQKREFADNPDCPVMTGWSLESHAKGQNSVWVRNPYYWCTDKAGNQLPYIDRIVQTNYLDPEVMKLQVYQGNVDFLNTGFVPMTLADVSSVQDSAAKSGLELRYWDSGLGTTPGYYFNYDYVEPKMRNLAREPKFRKAMSYAFNRAEVQKSLFFNTGELTSGTYSPKAAEFNVSGGQDIYKSWRDSALKYDPTLAKQLLDEIGVKDVNGDGWREMPDGSPLKITLDYLSVASQDIIAKNELLARDWKAVGINAVLNSVPQPTWIQSWASGKLMVQAVDDLGQGTSIAIAPQFLVPIESGHWAPLEGQFYAVRGTPKETEEQDKDPFQRTPPRMEPEKGGPIERLWDLYGQVRTEADPVKRTSLIWEMIKIHVDEGPFFSGVVGNIPRMILLQKDLRNVPKREDLALGGFVDNWAYPTPAVYDTEAFYWDNPEQHT
jgi:peptide/nickel transport system substrate-binding protein